MKKISLGLSILAISAILASCGSGSSDDTSLLESKIAVLESKNAELEAENQIYKTLANEATDAYKESPETDPVKNEKKTYGLGDAWTVEEQWTFTIDSVTVTEDRNQYSDTSPDEVVIIKYTFENLGYESDTQDLYMTGMKVVDEKGEMAASYPANTSVSPQPTPVGAKCVGAEEAIGLNNESSTITIYMEKRSNDGEKHKATFVVPVEK